MSAEQVPERPTELPAVGLGGYDDPGFTIAYVEGEVQVVLGCDNGEKVAFKMEAPVARRFFDKGYALMEAARRAEAERHMRRRSN